MIGPRGAAVLALHWQVNVIKPEGFFGGMLGEPVARSGVVGRAAEFHAAARAAGAQLVFTRFTVPVKGSSLVRNTGFMRAVGDAQDLSTFDSTAIEMHWNGRRWSMMASPAPGGTSALFAVQATPAVSPWAVGEYGLSTQVQRTLAFHCR